MKELGIALAIVLGVGLIILGPLVIIWSLNILFPILAIPYSWKTWVAVFVIVSALNARITLNNNK
jgi:glucan phosphoethanolaminetransferase (alkaline phosphatase superfamily)